MSRLDLCDYPGCGKPAAFRIISRRIVGAVDWGQSGIATIYEIRDLSPGLDTCDDHYDITHPGRTGGGWWDDVPAPQRAVLREPTAITLTKIRNWLADNLNTYGVENYRLDQIEEMLDEVEEGGD